MSIRVYHAPIRYQDKYEVSRKRKSIYVTFLASGNVDVDEVYVRGFAEYAEDPLYAYELYLLGMIVDYIYQVSPLREYPEFRGNYEERRRGMRGWVEDHLDLIPES